MVAFIYFHLMGDRNPFPPPGTAAAQDARIFLEAGEHLHELLSGVDAEEREMPSAVSRPSPSDATVAERQTTAGQALSGAARGVGRKG